jgi:hypothetical protein
VNSRWKILFLAVAILTVAGTLLRNLVAPAWESTCRDEPAFQASQFRELAGQGLTLGLLGGLRTLMADLIWLQMHLRWEQRDRAATRSLLRLATAVDPRPLYFWINGTRIIAYDFPTWQITAARPGVLPRAARDRIRCEEAAAALTFIDAGMAYHPASAELWIERASIELNLLGEVGAAAESYRRAWQLPGAPYYAARLHAQLLRRAGRPAEALAWLKQLHPTLPAQDEAAAADLVLERIRELERDLGVSAEKSYPGARQSLLSSDSGNDC